ncbi:class I SAM-dependent methyltransferase [Pseudalkalibacillus sp. SCS-8]|uniref:class I SAM-dependent methyltransferase n=1 Tax=Pseudalkalibacillus nanhaiensis TaxID=3115291 RepID=UPI0032D9C929
MENKFSVIAHRNHQICNPFSMEKLMRVLTQIPWRKGNRVLDIGAGKCEVLIELINRFEVEGTAIELEKAFVEDAWQNAEGRIPFEHLSVINEDAKKVLPRYDQSFDVVMCLGASHAIGDYRTTLAAMSKAVKPGGYLLVGEGYWKRKPDEAYLEALGAKEEELLTHAENIKEGEAQGLIPMWATVTNEDEWDNYEWLYSSSMETYCLENPDDPDVAWMRERIRKWRTTYLRWGRDTLGFGLYLFYRK